MWPMPDSPVTNPETARRASGVGAMTGGGVDLLGQALRAGEAQQPLDAAQRGLLRRCRR